MTTERLLPNTGRLCVLLVAAAAYLGWAAYFRSFDEVNIVDGSVGVILGLFICSHPAANGIELMFLRQGALRRVAARWNGVGWLVLNLVVLVVGWAVLVAGTTQFTMRAN